MYQPRKIAFQELHHCDDWWIKIYTIAKQGDFDQFGIYGHAKDKLPTWLAMENSFDASHDHMAFLIVHAGTEGVFSIINWWVGTNMLNTHVFITEYENPSQFRKISGDGLAPCIWEMEVINHERIAWTEQVLKKSEPDYQTYLNSIFSR
ncbi:MAG: hypothetical protein AAGF87_11130, partial [Bacteroidota bacterium]